MQAKKGFTLIELLVVIAIIAILAAILFPVFAAVRNQAKLATCLSHVKQLSGAIMMYSEEWNGFLPGFNLFNKSKRGYAATPTLDDLPSSGSLWKYYKSAKLIHCPSDIERLHAPAGLNFSSYSLNAWVSWRKHKEYFLGDPGEIESGGPPLSLFQRPTKTIALVEERTDASEVANVIDYAFISGDELTTRHSGKGVVSFLDGHVRAVKGDNGSYVTATWDDGSYMFHE